jgi:natural product biosynthesis luciferase-like monooxygenase protein
MRTDLASQGAFWQQQVAAAAPAFEWPLDRARVPAPSFLRETLSHPLDASRWASVQRLASALSLEPFTLVLAATALLAWRYNGQDVLWIGSAATARDAQGQDKPNLVGLRIDVPVDGTIADFLAAVQRAMQATADHRDTPFATVAAAAGQPLFRTLVLPQGVASPLWSGEQAPNPQRLGAHAAACELVLSVVGRGEAGELRVQYDPDLFDEATIVRLLGQVDTVLGAIAVSTDLPLSAVPLATEAERNRLVTELNRTARDFDRQATIASQIEAQVAKTPGAPALVFAGETLSYAELDAAANRLAHLLIEKGVGPDVPVGVCIERSATMVIAVLAVLKAGGAYIPMDPSYPAQRIAYMAEDSHVRLVLADRELTGMKAEVLRVESVPEAGHPATSPGLRSKPEHLAYVIYTSGSTGNPKGVMVEQRNVVNFFAGMDDRLGTEPGTWLAVTSLSFDISVLELLWTLTHGYKVVLHGSRPAPARGAKASSVNFGLFYFGSDDGVYAKATGRDKYKLLLEGAKFADENGFHAVWTPERHFHIFGGMYPSPSVAAGALAVHTQNVKIRAGSVVLPLHNPVRVAEEWSLVDNLSQGRVGISFASGWQPQDFAIAPQAFADRHNLMFEGIETVRALWRGEQRVLPGGDGKPVTVTTRPRPVQPELPVFVTAGGSPETFRRAGEIGASVLTHLLGQSIEQLSERIAIYRKAWREHGHAGDGHVALMLHTFVSDDLAFVRQTVHEPLKNYLKGSVGLFAPVAAAKGLDVNNLSPQDLEDLAEMAFERYFVTSGLFGTPETCAPFVANLEALGVDELACLIDFGIHADTVLANLRHLAALQHQVKGGQATNLEPLTVGEMLSRHAVSHMQCTPSMASMLVGDPAQAPALAGLKRLMVGGEALPEALAAELRAAMPQGQLTNMYGPTETTVWSSTHDVDGAAGPIPLGKPIANTQLYVLDTVRNVVPAGVVGELYIGGDGVTRGYFERPELTAERFLPDPYTGGRMYRTGDLARFRADGSLDFLGRVDFQVKLRGYRIELGEIESALRRDEAVAESAVSVLEDTPGDKRLVAYLVARPGQAIDVNALRTALRAQLAEFMVPQAFIVLPSFPRTPNGKLDRNALPRSAPAGADADTAPVAAAASVAAPTEVAAATDGPGIPELQSKIAAIWAEVLKVKSVGLRENFFDLGGHSLLVVHVLNKVRALTPKEIAVTDIFRFPTVESLAAHLAAVPAVNADGAAQPSAAQQRAAARRGALRGR